jgi:hypothetical protein
MSTFNFSPPTSSNYASGITFDSSGNLYVIDQSHGTIDEYNSTTGAYIRTVVSGLPSGPPAGGVGLTFANGSLYVTSTSGIEQFSLNGTPGAHISGRTYYDITTGPNGNLFAADGSHSVYEFTTAGTPVGSGPFVTGVSGAYGAGFGPDGSIYVAGLGSGVYKFDSSGDPIGSSPFFQYNQSGSPGLVDLLYDAGPASVPEPGTITLLMIGIATVGFQMARVPSRCQ